jgi:ferredoxin
MGANAQPATACNGCGICVLPCPAWWDSRDMMVTPRGILRALQGNARAEDLRDTLFHCSMCGACEPVCPLDIDILGTFRELRGAIPSPLPEPVFPRPPRNGTAAVRQKRVLVPGPALSRSQGLLNLVVGILGASAAISVADDDGHDLALTLETGAAVDTGRVQEFLAPFRQAGELVVVEGILHRFLRRRLPRLRVTGLAEALLRIDQVRRSLRPADFLVVDARSFHSDHHRNLDLFDRVRRETGCQMNLDLQRLAIPTTADATAGNRATRESTVATAIRWMLEGRKIDRIVAESPLDIGAFRTHTDVPVVHLAEIAGGAVPS